MERGISSSKVAGPSKLAGYDKARKYVEFLRVDLFSKITRRFPCWKDCKHAFPAISPFWLCLDELKRISEASLCNRESPQFLELIASPNLFRICCTGHNMLMEGKDPLTKPAIMATCLQILFARKKQPHRSNEYLTVF